jgi:hypothetical protein
VECDPAEANPTYDGARNVKEHQNVQQRPKDRTIPRERFFHESDLWLHGDTDTEVSRRRFKRN